MRASFAVTAGYEVGTQLLHFVNESESRYWLGLAL